MIPLTISTQTFKVIEKYYELEKLIQEHCERPSFYLHEDLNQNDGYHGVDLKKRELNDSEKYTLNSTIDGDYTMGLTNLFLQILVNDDIITPGNYLIKLG